MGFSRQEYQSGLPFPTPGDLPHQRIEPMSLMSPTLANGFFTTSANWERAKNPGVGCYFLLQRFFLMQGSNPSLLHCKCVLYRWATREALGARKPSIFWHSVPRDNVIILILLLLVMENIAPPGRYLYNI